MPRHLARFMTLVGIVTFATAFIAPANGRAADSRRVDGSVATSHPSVSMPCDDVTAASNPRPGESVDTPWHADRRGWSPHT